MKTINYKTALKKNLKDKEFKSEYDAFEEEFNIAKEIIQLRKKRNLTQKDLANLIGSSQPAIARLESGNYKNISFSFLRKVASALGAEAEIHLREKSA